MKKLLLLFIAIVVFTVVVNNVNAGYRGHKGVHSSNGLGDDPATGDILIPYFVQLYGHTVAKSFGGGANAQAVLYPNGVNIIPQGECFDLFSNPQYSQGERWGVTVYMQYSAGYHYYINAWTSGSAEAYAEIWW